MGKDKGGLGIRNLTLMNRALLGKWAWKFAIEDNSAWKRIISLKYVIEEGDGSQAFQEAIMELVFGKP